MKAQQNNSGPVPWVDNVKLLAMLGVLSFHFWIFFNKRVADPLQYLSSVKAFLTLPFDLGWQGNELFIATSGLGLALSYARKKPSFPQFLGARAWRIYLPYWVTIAAVFAYQIAMHLLGTWDVPYVLPRSPQEWIANIFLLNMNGTTFFSTHHWFLFTLVALYLLFPLFFHLCRRLGVFALAVTALLQLANIHFQPNFGPFAAVMSLTYWMGSFCVGILIGLAIHDDRAKLERRLNRAWPLGLVLWAAGTLGNFYGWSNAFVDPLIAMGAFLCVYQLARLHWSLPWLNKITFEIYLVHMPFVGFYRHFFGFVTEPLWAIYLFYLVSSVLLGYIVHLLIRAVDAGVKRLRARPTPTPTAAA